MHSGNRDIDASMHVNANVCQALKFKVLFYLRPLACICGNLLLKNQTGLTLNLPTSTEQTTTRVAALILSTPASL